MKLLLLVSKKSKNRKFS